MDTAGVQESLLMKPHLNTALRAEILFFTTKGILFSIQEYNRLSTRSRERNRARRGKDKRKASAVSASVIPDMLHLQDLVEAEEEEEEEDDEESVGGPRDSEFLFKDKLDFGCV